MRPLHPLGSAGRTSQGTPLFGSSNLPMTLPFSFKRKEEGTLKWPYSECSNHGLRKEC